MAEGQNLVSDKVFFFFLAESFIEVESTLENLGSSWRLTNAAYNLEIFRKFRCSSLKKQL